MLAAVEEELQKAIPLPGVELGRKAEKCSYKGPKFSSAVCKMRLGGRKNGKLKIVTGTQRKEIYVQKQNDSLENGKSFNRSFCNVRGSYV